MADNSGGRLGLMAFAGFLLFEIGVTGKLGSILASVIDPGSLVETPSGGSGTGLITGLPTVGTLTAAQIAGYAINAGFPASSIQIATAIALAESSGNTQATNYDTNGTVDLGLWQINSIHGYDSTKLLQPAYNAQAAYDISSGGVNWNPWSTYTNGRYLSFMATALAGAQAAAYQNVGA